MTLFRIGLAVMWIVLVVYTGAVIAEHGMGLLPVFFGDMVAGGWPGQFNLDFLGFLVLSALWVSWRHRFTPGGLALGLVAFFGGIGFLAPYLFVASRQAKDDVSTLLMGPSRMSGS